MKYSNDLTFDEYIDIKRHDIGDLHKKAMDILKISHVTWKRKRKRGDLLPFELHLLATHLFDVAPAKLFKFCENSAKIYYKLK